MDRLRPKIPEGAFKDPPFFGTKFWRELVENRLNPMSPAEVKRTCNKFINFAETADIKIIDMTLEEVQRASSQDNLPEMERIFKEIQTCKTPSEYIERSTMIFSKDGQPLAYYVADMPKLDPKGNVVLDKEGNEIPVSPFEKEECENLYQAHEDLTEDVIPVLPLGDRRHNEGKTHMAYLDFKDDRAYKKWVQSGKDLEEALAASGPPPGARLYRNSKNAKCGVLHLGQAYREQGHTRKKEDNFGLSGDLILNTKEKINAMIKFRTEYTHFHQVAAILMYIISNADYVKLTASFAHGKIDANSVGPFLTMAVLQRVQCQVHTDSEDFPGCITMPCGYYVGGDMIFPLFRLRFKYTSGTIMHLMSPYVWHGVATWRPVPKRPGYPDIQGDGVLNIPGRLSFVLFTHSKTHDHLKDEKLNYRKSNQGLSRKEQRAAREARKERSKKGQATRKDNLIGTKKQATRIEKAIVYQTARDKRTQRKKECRAAAQQQAQQEE